MNAFQKMQGPRIDRSGSVRDFPNFGGPGPVLGFEIFPGPGPWIPDRMVKKT